MLSILLIATLSNAQVVGKLGEMDRLEQQADDLATQADPEGAALAIGKAAMMADLLRSESRVASDGEIYQAASLLYRAQELGFRALALFEQTGGTTPAPGGVCHYLIQGNKKLNDSMNLLTKNPASPKEHLQMTHTHLVNKNEEWGNLLQGLSEDLACPIVSHQ